MSTPAKIEELRTLFSQKVAAGLPNLQGDPHPADLERVKDDGWLKKFLEHQENDVTLALQMLVETVVWRKTFGTNDINESNINMEYMHDGLFYPRGQDIDNCTIFVFKSKKHSRGARDFEELKRCVVYWFERLDKIQKCNRISVFFDMADTGMSNMDMEFTRYLISLFKYYYPNFLNYILIFEMPWILNAAFKVIKQLLPAKAINKMKFVSKSSLNDFVPPNSAHKSWGGADDYTYVFIPEPNVGVLTISTSDMVKKVTFSDPGSPGQELASKLPTEEAKVVFDPDDVVVFSLNGKDMTGSLKITNCLGRPIAYKIKTTSPEKFRIRPSVGTLSHGAVQQIELCLLESYQQPAASKEKFMVLWLPIEEEELSGQDLIQLWKHPIDPLTKQHKLRCSYIEAKAMKNGNSAAMSMLSEEKAPSTVQSVDNNLQRLESLDGQLKSLKTIQLLNLVLTSILLCSIMYFFKYVSREEGEFCSRP